MTEDGNRSFNENPTTSMIDPATSTGQDDAPPDLNSADDRPFSRKTPRQSRDVSLIHASLGIQDMDHDDVDDSQYYYPASERTIRNHSYGIIIVEAAVDDSMIQREHVHFDEDRDGDGDALGNPTGQDKGQDKAPNPKKLSYLQQASPMHERYTYREHIFIATLGMILSFNSGFSNGVTLSGILTPDTVKWSTQSTSGYTGIYTNSALVLADTSREAQGHTRIQFFGFQICMILCFISGACISALLNPRPMPWRLAPMYAPTFLLGECANYVDCVTMLTVGRSCKSPPTSPTPFIPNFAI
jgi:hypothetical protein